MATIIIKGLSNHDAKAVVNNLDSGDFESMLEDNYDSYIDVTVNDSVKSDEDGDDVYTLDVTVEETDEKDDDDEDNG